MTDPRGMTVAVARNGDRWPILNADGPFCVFEAGNHRLQVRARQGRGAYALRLWKLP
jgi:hypothetical protein